MFTAILAILGLLVVIGGIAYFVVNYWSWISGAWSWASGLISGLSSLCPSWLAVFLGALVILALVGIVLKVV